MLVGVRSHDYGKQPIAELPALLKSRGLNAAQIVLPKAFTEIHSYEEVTADHLEMIRESFDTHQVKIHILGCYMDLANPDDDVRKAAVETFKTCLSYGKILNAGIVGTETAYPRLSREEKAVWQPYMMDSIARLVEEAERVGMDMAIEPVYCHPLENLEVTCSVFEKMNSARLKMIFDPANVLEFPEINQGEYWNQWLKELGGKVEAMHVKDFTEGPNKEYQPLALGHGVMDYTEIIRWLKMNKPDIVMIREEMNPETDAEDIAYLQKLWGK
ncbi:MAG: sugar phosphate isomerase/epimerase family protein [Lachnospiraceae bacterium]